MNRMAPDCLHQRATHRLGKPYQRRENLAETIIQACAVEKYYPQPDGNRIEVIAPTDLERLSGKDRRSAGSVGFGQIDACCAC